MRLIELFKQSIGNNKLSEFTEEYAEITIDSLTDNEFLKNIPIVKGVLALAEIKTSIHQKHTIKKIARFLQSLESISESEISDFLNQQAQDKKEEEFLYENLLIMIDRLDQTEKAFILGNLFKLYILKIISKDILFRLASIIERAYLTDLLALYHGYNHRLPKSNNNSFIRQIQKQETRIALINLGLMKEKEIAIASRSSNTPVYSLTKLGNDLAHMLYYTESDIHYLRNSHNSYL